MAPLIAGAPLSPLVADVRSGQSHAHLSSSRHAPVLGRSHNKSHSHGYGREGLFQRGAPTGVFNVLHMISDDLGGGFLPNYGHKDVIAPNLLKLGQSGVTFDMAYTQWSQCAPNVTGNSKKSRIRQDEIPTSIINCEADWATGV